MQMQVNHHEDVFQNHTENIRQNSNHVENSMDLLLTRYYESNCSNNSNKFGQTSKFSHFQVLKSRASHHSELV